MSAVFGIGVVPIAGFAVVASLRSRRTASLGHRAAPWRSTPSRGSPSVIIGAAIVLGIYIMTSK